MLFNSKQCQREAKCQTTTVIQFIYRWPCKETQKNRFHFEIQHVILCSKCKFYTFRQSANDDAFLSDQVFVNHHTAITLPNNDILTDLIISLQVQ